jgi:hypothetical protein
MNSDETPGKSNADEERATTNEVQAFTGHVRIVKNTLTISGWWVIGIALSVLAVLVYLIWRWFSHL